MSDSFCDGVDSPTLGVLPQLLLVETSFSSVIFSQTKLGVYKFSNPTDFIDPLDNLLTPGTAFAESLSSSDTEEFDLKSIQGLGVRSRSFADISGINASAVGSSLGVIGVCHVLVAFALDPPE